MFCSEGFTNFLDGNGNVWYNTCENIEGEESYPSGYMKDISGTSNKYMIGITFDELNRMIYNISG